MKILFTGASSFSGFWFCKKLAEKGHQVFATFTRSAVEDYPEAGFARERFRRLQQYVSPLWGVRSGSDTFIHLIKEETWNRICLHASYVTGHQSAKFPLEYAVEQNTQGMDCFIPLLRRRSISVVWTGTYYEANEGKGSDPGVDISPYACSKRLSWEHLDKLGKQAVIPVGKFVMPNPFGSWEGKGFTRYLISSWLKSETPVVKMPNHILDNCPVDLLALEYANYVELNHELEKQDSLKPSFYVSSANEFAFRVKEAFELYSNSKVDLLSANPTGFDEPICRFNEAKVSHLHQWSESNFWRSYMHWAYKNMQSSKS